MGGMQAVFALLVLSALALVSTATDPVPTTFATYAFQGMFYVGPVKMPLNVYTTPTAQRIDYYGGMDTDLFLFSPQNMAYSVHPNNTHVQCDAQSATGTGATPFQPDFTNFTFVGTATLNGNSVNHFQSNVSDFNRTNYYDYYAMPDGTPVQFHMLGYDTVFGSHYDVYVLDYGVFSTGAIDPSLFFVPQVCNSASSGAGSAGPHFGQALQFLTMFRPAARHHDEFVAFAAKHNRTYTTSEFVSRREIFRNNDNFIKHHNARNAAFKLAHNRFSDMTHAEYLAIMLPAHQARVRVSAAGQARHVPQAAAFAATEAPHSLPASVDWRDKGVVFPPKDQAACGSCWAFSAIGAIEGAWALKTGSLVSLSEQHIVDCAWDYDNAGCGGGLSSLAFEYLINNTGVASEAAYPYLGANGFCSYSPARKAAAISSYVNITMGDEAALQAAVATIGPISVGIDASHDSFSFYASGVYNEPLCLNGIDDLDHAVLVVGYGTDPQGGDYWIVRNSWALNWGNGGYIWMSRNNKNQCGIATQASYPVV